MRLTDRFRGTAEIVIRGDAPEECLNHLVAENIAFWNICYGSEKEVTICILSKDVEAASELCLSACCALSPLRKGGLPILLHKVLSRPLLWIGLLLSIVLSFYLQRFVWSVEVKGEDSAVDRRIIQLLQERGIGFGSNGTTLDAQKLKLEMLRQLPELSWMTVNRKGGRLTVLYLLSDEKEEADGQGAANLTALRDGVIIEYTVLEGMRLFSAGDIVRKGQVLVSGFEDYGLCLKAVRAEGEIYAETWHSGSVLSPAFRYEKTYTGREWTEYVIIFGRKRINLFGNSGISTARCDKIIDEQIFRLPDLEFPLRLQILRYREYAITAVPKDAKEVRASMESHWAEETRSSMVAGCILETESMFVQQSDYFVLHINSTCHEMIATTVPMEGLSKGETYE